MAKPRPPLPTHPPSKPPRKPPSGSQPLNPATPYRKP